MTESADQPNSKMFMDTFPVGPLQCNCAIIGDTVSKRAMVIDPGGDADRILKVLNDNDLRLVSIIHTHAHLDHILASGVLKEATGAGIYLHKGDKMWWDMAEDQCKMFNVPYEPLPDPDFWLEDDEALCCCDGVALHTPGHTEGSMSFWFQNDKLLVAGDTLFKSSIGRTDLPGGDFKQIEKSIKERLYCLDDEAMVITGHGPATQIGAEKISNPFVQA
ncbi:MAG: MBL fold metallo-hydrolase [Pseudomonadales bacterium]